MAQLHKIHLKVEFTSLVPIWVTDGHASHEYIWTFSEEDFKFLLAKGGKFTLE